MNRTRRSLLRRKLDRDRSRDLQSPGGAVIQGRGGGRGVVRGPWELTSVVEEAEDGDDTDNTLISTDIESSRVTSPFPSSHSSEWEVRHINMEELEVIPDEPSAVVPKYDANGQRVFSHNHNFHYDMGTKISAIDTYYHSYFIGSRDSDFSDDYDDYLTTQKDMNLEDREAEKKLKVKRKKRPLFGKDSLSTPSGQATESEEMSYGDGILKKTSPKKILDANEAFQRNIQKLSTGMISLRLNLEEVDEDDERFAFFSIDGDLNVIVRCTINAENSLKDAEWWLANKALLEGQSNILCRTFYEYIRSYVSEEIVIDREQIEPELAEGNFKITVNVVKTEEDICKFEEILLKKCKPILVRGEMKKSYLVRLDTKGDIYFGLDDTLFRGIMNYLNNPRSKDIIEPRDESHRIMYEMFYEDFQVKKFLAPLGDNWQQLYRVEILKKFPNTDEYQVSYVDLGREERITVDKFACMTRMAALPPLLEKIPPQIQIGHLTSMSALNYPLSLCIKMEGQSLMVKLIGEPTKLNNNTARVVVFRCPKLNENCRNILSLNDYLKVVGELNYELGAIKITPKTQEMLHSLWEEFQNEKDSLSFVDKLYEQYFFSTRGVLLYEDE